MSLLQRSQFCGLWFFGLWIVAMTGFTFGQEPRLARTHRGSLLVATPDFAKATRPGQQVGQLPAGAKLQVMASQADPRIPAMNWLRVKVLTSDLAGSEGWLSSSHIEWLNEPVVSQESDHVLRSCLILREPGMAQSVARNNQLGIADAQTELEIISSVEDPSLPLRWYRVRLTNGPLEGKVGWLSSSNVMVTNVRHVTNADGKGWLVIRWEDGTTVPAVPQFLKVEFLKSEGGRDFFKVLEGLRTGELASVKRKSETESYLAPGHPATEARTLKFDRTKRQLWFGSSGPIDAKTDDDNPVPLGLHDLELPDEVHAIGEAYLKDSPYATTWFRVGHQGDRFLHPGQISAGCITVTDTQRWTELYEYLIKARKGDGKSVGTVEVVESP